jgi:hypothetical protein
LAEHLLQSQALSVQVQAASMSPAQKIQDSPQLHIFSSISLLFLKLTKKLPASQQLFQAKT